MQVRKSISRLREKLGGLFLSPNVKQKGKDLEMLCRGMIINLICCRIAKGTVKSSQDIIGKQYIKNDGALAFSDEDMKIALKNCQG